MLGHIRQAEYDLVFDKSQNIKALRPQDTLDEIIGVGISGFAGIKVSLGVNHLQTVQAVDAPCKRLHAALAFKHRTSLDLDPQKTLAKGIHFALNYPFHCSVGLFRQTFEQTFELSNCSLAANLVTSTGKLVRVNILYFHAWVPHTLIPVPETKIKIQLTTVLSLPAKGNHIKAAAKRLMANTFAHKENIR